MSENGLVDCPACGELVAAGMVCEECGADISGVMPVDKPPVNDLDAPRAPVAKSSQPGTTEGSPAKAGLPPVAEARDRSSASAQRAHSAEDEEDFEDDCPHFHLEYNDARVFVQGMTASFNFRLIPVSAEGSECKSPQVEVQIADEPAKKENIRGIRARRPKSVDVNFCPKNPGFDIASKVQLTYYMKGQRHSYMADFKWDCVGPDEPGKMIENLVIKMGKMEAGMAADQNINILKDFENRKGPSLSSRLQDLKLKPIWKRLELFDSSEGSNPPPEGRIDRVTLLGPGETRLHLLGGERFTMGRSKNGDCDMLTYLFKRMDCPDPALSSVNGISRYQAQLIFCAGRWELRDGGIDPKASLSRMKPSSYGTYLNGNKINGSTSLDSGAGQQMLTFGRPNSGENTFGFKVSVFKDPENGKPSAVLLERMDRISESFLCICGKVDFEAIFPNMADGSLRFRKGGFKHRDSIGEQWLKPGSPFGFGWSCQTYAQAGFQTNTQN